MQNKRKVVRTKKTEKEHDGTMPVVWRGKRLVVLLPSWLLNRKKGTS